jgi:hypothetical protein
MERMEANRSLPSFAMGVSAGSYPSPTPSAPPQPYLLSDIPHLPLSPSLEVIAADTGFYDNDGDAANEVLQG